MVTEFLTKAEENLEAARLCADSGLYNASANRAYYAALQAAVAALADKGIKKRNKIDHGAVQADFNSLLIRKQKVYPARLKSRLLSMQSLRDQADYEPGNVSMKQASRQIAKSEEMVAIIKKEIIK
ncbi:HEPN domain-containing protein [Desulfococcaceae bacterium HSG8]|nr:HEPN domain-containing protein [Desulfococcaceae bacterium HSG8]